MKLHVCLAVPVGWRRAVAAQEVVMRVTCPDLDYFLQAFQYARVHIALELFLPEMQAVLDISLGCFPPDI